MASWHPRVALGLLLARLAVAVALLPLAIDWRSPLLASLRPWTLAALIALPLLLIAIEAWTFRARPQTPLRRGLSIAVLATAGAGLIATLAVEGGFQRTQSRVLAADPGQLSELGRHFIVGYRTTAEIEGLIDRRGIGGVFVGARNVAGLSAPAIRSRIDVWQETRRRQALPPLLVATDQEGGAVSRLSPPLPRQLPLASLVAQHADAAARDAAAHAYGLTQGRALADLGINLNFAPVVDLDKNLVNPNDRYTRIHDRAIAADPHIVAEVARHYCRGLWEAGVRCTLKHFPGLGGVFEDTHLQAGHLRATLDELERSDFIPFRTLMSGESITMLAHARLTALDGERPVSFSDAVVAGLLRRSWGYDGVLITDDFSMGAVYASRQGIAEGSVAALNAGVDLILIAYDPAQYFIAIDAVLAAARAGTLRKADLARSRERLTGLQRAR